MREQTIESVKNLMGQLGTPEYAHLADITLFVKRHVNDWDEITDEELLAVETRLKLSVKNSKRGEKAKP